MNDPVDTYDAVVIGSGPNGLVAAATLARAGWSVIVLEGAAVAGGAVRSEALTVPGFVHDTFSAFYGLLHSAPTFTDLDLASRLEWADAEFPVAAVTRPDDAAVIHRDLEVTAKRLGPDADAWIDLVQWWDRIGRRFFAMSLLPVGTVRPALRFAWAGKIRGTLDALKLLLEPTDAMAAERFATPAGQALAACGITHADIGVDATGGAPLALILAMAAQQVGMPVPVGGAGRLADALVAIVEEAGGRVRVGCPVERIVRERGRASGVELAGGGAVRARRAVLADVAPRGLLRLAGDELPADYVTGLRRYRHGTGIFKVDLALDAPVPWIVPELGRSHVVHVCGDLDTMARSAFDARHATLPAAPALVVGQQSLADPTRAPAGRHTLWVETHVPSVPTADAAGAIAAGSWAAARQGFLDRVLDRLEAHAPGVRDLVAGIAVHTPVDLEAKNPNLVGGDLGGGSVTIDQQLVFRPVPALGAYRTPLKGLYLCSASTHPGGGVHGMCGRNAARAAIRDRRLRR